MTNIELKNISKSFSKKDKEIIKDLFLEIKSGEFACLLGASGSGKTTILRLVAGLEKPSEGKIYFDNKDVTKFAPEDRNIGMVFQDYALYLGHTVRFNIEFPLKNQKLNNLEIKHRVDRVTDMLHIVDLLEKNVTELSGGQKQRVAIARSLVKDPSVFLFDEPLANLDTTLRNTLRDELIHIHQEKSITSLYVTHDPTEAMILASKIFILDDGKIIQSGSTEELFSNPANIKTLKLLSRWPINILNMKVSKNGSGSYMDLGFLKKEVKNNDTNSLLTVISPEKIKLKPDYNGNFRIIYSKNIGDSWVYSLSNGNLTFKCIMPLSIKISSEENISLELDPKNVFLFSEKTGERIL